MAEAELQPASAKEYKAIRDAKWQGPGYVAWLEEDIAYAMEHAAFQQGETLLVKCCHEGEGEPQQHILMYTLDGDTMRIVESTLNLCQLPKLLPLLARRAAELHPESRKVRSFEYRLPDGMVWLPERLKTTRLKRRGYFNLVLD